MMSFYISHTLISAIEEIILETGYRCIFYSKFHCELNYIEWYWGAAKRYMRENCDYSWSDLQHTVPAALESVNIITIRWFTRKAWRYVDLYKKGITGKLAEYANYVLAELNKIKLICNKACTKLCDAIIYHVITT